MKYMMLVDVEGATGVTNYEQAENSVFGIDMLMNDINSTLEGILNFPGNEVTIFEEHTNGCNVRLEDIPEEVNIVRGKPIINGQWKGIDSSYDGIILIGFHARANALEALLPHTYSLSIENIWINNHVVGEIGMEAALAGENKVPLVMISGDSAGVKEAKQLVRGVHTVVVKEALDEFQAICYPPKKTSKLLREAGLILGTSCPAITPLEFGLPIDIKVELKEGPFKQQFISQFPDSFKEMNMLHYYGNSVAEAWSQYLRQEKEVNKNGEF